MFRKEIAFKQRRGVSSKNKLSEVMVLGNVGEDLLNAIDRYQSFSTKKRAFLHEQSNRRRRISETFEQSRQQIVTLLSEIIGPEEENKSIAFLCTKLHDCLDFVKDFFSSWDRSLLSLYALDEAEDYLLQFFIKQTLLEDLTGLYRKAAFLHLLEDKVAEFQESGLVFSVILFDADYFKSVNDTYGHVVGDEILQSIGTILKSVLRHDSDMLCRYGGEEFIVLLPEIYAPRAFIIAERIRLIVKCLGNHRNYIDGYLDLCKINGEERNLIVAKIVQLESELKLSSNAWRALEKLTISLGVSSIQKGQTPSEVIQFADEALYASKEAGRNQTIIR